MLFRSTTNVELVHSIPYDMHKMNCAHSCNMKFVVEPVDQDPNEYNEDNRLIHALFNNKVNDTPAVISFLIICQSASTAGVSFTLLLSKVWINLLSSLYQQVPPQTSYCKNERNSSYACHMEYYILIQH